MKAEAVKTKTKTEVQAGARMGISESLSNRDTAPEPWAQLLETDVQ